MASDLYEGFAERYDLFFGRFCEHDAVVVDFFGKLFAENQVHSVLDCACGTGHDLHLAVNRDECSRVFVIDHFERGARYNVLDISHSEKGRDLKVWSIDYANILLRDDQERLLKASGFKSVDFYGSYRFEPYDKEASDRLIAVAHK